MHDALENLAVAIQEVAKVLEEMRAEKDPLAMHIFVSRRYYRNNPPRDKRKAEHHLYCWHQRGDNYLHSGCYKQ